MELYDGSVTRNRSRRAASAPLHTSAVLTAPPGQDPASAFTIQRKWTTGDGKKKGGTTQGRVMKHMICRFCQHDELFNTFRMNDHLVSCEAYQEAQRRDAEMRHEEALSDPEPPPDATAAEIVGEISREADNIRSKRFAEIKPIMRPMVTKLQDSWAKYWPEWQELLQGAGTKVSKLREEGYPGDAEEVARAIKSLPTLHYSQFFISFDVPLGHEVLTVRGLDPLKLRESDKARWRELAGEPDDGLTSVPRHEVERLQQDHETTILELRSQHESWAEGQLDSSRKTLQRVREQHEAAIAAAEERNKKTQEKVEELRERLRIALAERHAADTTDVRSREELRRCRLKLKKLDEKYVRAAFDLTTKDQHISDLEKWSEGLQKNAEARREQDFLKIEEKLRDQFMSSLRRQTEKSSAELAGVKTRLAKVEGEREDLRRELSQASVDFQVQLDEMEGQRAAVVLHLSRTYAEHAEEIGNLERVLANITDERDTLRSQLAGPTAPIRCPDEEIMDSPCDWITCSGGVPSRDSSAEPRSEPSRDSSTEPRSEPRSEPSSDPSSRPRTGLGDGSSNGPSNGADQLSTA